MKKQLFLGLVAIGAFVGTATAQNNVQAQPSQQQEMDKTPNARTKETLLRLQNELNLTNDQGAKAYPIFFTFYDRAQKLREEMRNADPKPDWETMKAKRDNLAADRDKQLKDVFTADQYTKWKDVVEPSMRPQRKADGGPGRQN